MMSNDLNRPVILSDYLYDLPEERIAIHPISPRDHSRLLNYQQGQISHHHFYDLPHLLPQDSLLVFNETRVIPARVLLNRKTGAKIELLLTSPVSPSIPSLALQVTESCVWKCMIGNKKKWKQEEALTGVFEIGNNPLILEATWVDRKVDTIRFSWTPEQVKFSKVLETIGAPPLPPYLNRDPVEEDKARYQTVYAREEGAVAAPTAGLHFTQGILETLKDQGIPMAYVNLHVGIGTFAPVKTVNALDHNMHSEKISVSLDTIRQLSQHPGPIIAVGTTSLRVLESLYWFGVKIYRGIISSDQPTMTLSQNDPYEYEAGEFPKREACMEYVLNFMENRQLSTLHGDTSLYIVPGYTFRMCEGLITNYHQPGSTLILLIAAFTGTDWRKIYHEALKSGYRFLSYGDSSLLLP